MSSSKTPDDDGQYGASLESSARDETRPTKYPSHLRGSGRVSERTKRSAVEKVRLMGYEKSVAGFRDQPSFALGRTEGRIVSCREAPGR